MNCTAAIGHQLLATSTPKLRQQEQSTRPDPLLHMAILIIPELLLITVVKANATGDGCKGTIKMLPHRAHQPSQG